MRETYSEIYTNLNKNIPSNDELALKCGKILLDRFKTDVKSNREIKLEAQNHLLESVRLLALKAKSVNSGFLLLNKYERIFNSFTDIESRYIAGLANLYRYFFSLPFINRLSTYKLFPRKAVLDFDPESPLHLMGDKFWTESKSGGIVPVDLVIKSKLSHLDLSKYTADRLMTFYYPENAKNPTVDEILKDVQRYR